MPGFVYILEDDMHMFYIGSSTDVEARFKRHLSGFVHTTHRMKNPKIVLSQEYPTIQEAKSVELKLKKLKRKDYIQKIVRDGKINMKP